MPIYENARLARNLVVSTLQQSFSRAREHDAVLAQNSIAITCPTAEGRSIGRPVSDKQVSQYCQAQCRVEFASVRNKPFLLAPLAMSSTSTVINRSVNIKFHPFHFVKCGGNIILVFALFAFFFVAAAIVVVVWTSCMALSIGSLNFRYRFQPANDDRACQ